MKHFGSNKEYDPIRNAFWWTAAVASFWLPFKLLWRQNVFASPEWRSILPIGICFVSILLHEGLHGVGLHFLGGVSWRSVKFGVNRWPYLNPYTSFSVPITMQAYRRMLALPGVVLGLIPGIVGVTIGNVGLTLWGIINCVLASADILLILQHRHEPADRIGICNQLDR